MKRLLLTLVTLTALATSALAQRGYDNSTLVVVYTSNQTLAQNLQSLNDFIDQNIEPELEYWVTAESTPFDFIFGFRLVRFRAFDENGETLMWPNDYRVLDGLQPFWDQEIPLNVTAVYTNDFGSAGDDIDVMATTVLSGQSTTATVMLSRPAGAGGVRVTLRSSSTSARVPASVVVPAGQRRVTFQITTRPVTRSTNVRITAMFRGGSKSDSFTIRPR